MSRSRTLLISTAVALPLVGLVWLAPAALDPAMRGPRGYYVQKEDPAVYIEFFAKPKARSNIVQEFGDAEYSFYAYDGEIKLSGPIGAPVAKQRHYEIYGDGREIRVQDLSATPIPSSKVFPVTHYTRREK